MDIFDENKNLHVIKRKLTHKIEQNHLFLKSATKEEKDVEEKKDKPKDFPQENIEKMLKSIGMAGCIAKLKEEQINEPDIFFELSEDTLTGILGIDTEGKKWRFKEKMKEIKEKHEKAKAKKE